MGTRRQHPDPEGAPQLRLPSSPPGEDERNGMTHGVAPGELSRRISEKPPQREGQVHNTQMSVTQNPRADLRRWADRVPGSDFREVFYFW